MGDGNLEISRLSLLTLLHITFLDNLSRKEPYQRRIASSEYQLPSTILASSQRARFDLIKLFFAQSFCPLQGSPSRQTRSQIISTAHKLALLLCPLWQGFKRYSREFPLASPYLSLPPVSRVMDSFKREGTAMIRNVTLIGTSEEVLTIPNARWESCGFESKVEELNIFLDST